MSINRQAKAMYFFPLRHFFFMLIGFLCLASLFFLWRTATYISHIAGDLPDVRSVRKTILPAVTSVYARDGSLIGTLYKEKRYPIALSELPPHVTAAFLAAEDSAFYEHVGIDIPSIIRAALVNSQQKTVKEGASTITQQLVKRLFLTSEKTFERKIKEALLAIRLERIATKDEILELYMNHVFFGCHAYGIEAAARTFFDKPAKNLDIREAAFLAGLVKAPGTYNPYRNRDGAEARYKYVLTRLHALNWITEEEYSKALQEKPNLHAQKKETVDEASQWYLEEVRRLLIEFLTRDNLRAMHIDTDLEGEAYVLQAGLTVSTAMDPKHQKAAYTALQNGLREMQKRHGWHGAKRNLSSEERALFLSEKRTAPENDETKEGIITKIEGGKITVSFSKEASVIVPYASWLTTLDRVHEKRARKPAVNDLVSVQCKETGCEIVQDVPIQGAIASIETESGDVVALVGGYSFSESQSNRATQARRQPGSSFKPIVYSAALDNGYTTITHVLDGPITFINGYGKRWSPSNFEHSYLGWLPLHKALALSRNTCSVRIAYDIGIENVIEQAKNLGIAEDLPEELAVSLGAIGVSPLSMAQAYSVFANGGIGVKPRVITAIADRQKHVFYRQEKETWRAISPENAYCMTNMLREVVEHGTGVRAKIPGRVIAGKTGTSNRSRDAWFVGFSPFLSTSVYLGRDSMKPMNRDIQGGRAAAPIFAAYRKKIENLYPNQDFVVPESIVFKDGQPIPKDMLAKIEEERKEEEGEEIPYNGELAEQYEEEEGEGGGEEE